jgi:hypothetical protein
MTTSPQSRALRLIGRIGEIWTEIDQAQRRRLEFRADLHAPTHPGRPTAVAMTNYRDAGRDREPVRAPREGLTC